MNRKTAFIHLGIIVVLLIVVLAMPGKKTEESDQGTKVSSYIYPDTLTDYFITSFETHEGQTVWYEGVAMHCDMFGGCDSINFISDIEPIIGEKMNFIIYAGGYESGWQLVKAKANQ